MNASSNKIQQTIKLISPMTSRSLSPLSKDPFSVGKLISKQQRSCLINEQSQTRQFPIRDVHNPEHASPKNIKASTAINTSRLNYVHQNEAQEIKPITQQQRGYEFKADSNVHKIDLISKPKRSNKKINVSSQKIDKWARKSGFFRSSLQKNRNGNKSPIGTIFNKKHTGQSTRSAPKDTTTSPQLPSLNKIQNNLKGFRNFMGDTQISPFTATINSLVHNPSKKQIGKTYNSYIFTNNKRNDPEEQQKLHQPRRGLRNSRTIKMTHLVEEKQKQFQMQTSFERRQSSPIYQSGVIHRKLNIFDSESEQDFSSSSPQSFEKHSHQFIYSPSASPYSFKIDLRTPISRIKQLLIESSDILHVSFMIPQIFFHPPSHDASPKELHYLMVEIFKYIDMSPQIVTIKKYMNCVMMCDKNLCILWSYNGKVYFGGWDKNVFNPQNSQNKMLTQGNKHGIGLEWIPSRYIYYGQFKDNKKQGYGIMKKVNKEVYVGEWRTNQRQGWGKVYNMLGQMVQNGEFIEGCYIRDREKGRYEH